jgi:hypothetical protein
LRRYTKVRTAADYEVGCHVKVFWRQDDAWYRGVIEDQQAAGDLILSKAGRCKLNPE